MRFSSARVKEAEQAVLNTLLWPKVRVIIGYLEEVRVRASQPVLLEQ